jgi:hypothetical protein
LKRPCQKSLPPSLFQREESFPGFDGEFLPLVPPLEKGDEGGFDGFSKGKKKTVTTGGILLWKQKVM